MLVQAGAISCNFICTNKIVFLVMSKTKSTKINYAIPGDPMDQQEFEQMIKKAESETFHPIEVVKTELAKWKAKYQR